MSENTPILLPGIVGGDKRITPRVQCEIIAGLPGEGSDLSIPLVDLSVSGCSLRLASPMVVGDRLTITLQFPGISQPVTLDGQVRNNRPQGQDFIVGLEFESVSMTTRRFMANFVRNNLKEPVEILKLPKRVGESSWEIHRRNGATTEMILCWNPDSLELLVPTLRRLIDTDTLFVPCDTRALQEGVRVKFQLFIPETHIRLMLGCEVIWVQPPTATRPMGLGLRRDPLMATDEAAIRAIVSLYQPPKAKAA